MCLILEFQPHRWKNFADARLDTERGVVVCTAEAAYIDAVELFGPESFHNNDYAFYYENLRENIKQRVENYIAGDQPSP